MISIENLSKEFRKSGVAVPVLSGVSLTVNKGEWLTVTGSSGAGKSTLLYAIAGLLRPSGGSVKIDGTDIFKLSAAARARFRGDKIGIIFQSFHLFPQLTVLQNVLVSGGRFGTDVKAAEQILDQMGLSSRKSHLPSELSVGEKQRAAMARAVFCRPLVLLADEPTGNLDAQNGNNVIQSLRGFNKLGMTVIFVTHKPHSECEPFSTRLLHLSRGRLEPA
jgi:ABC-type lipoprotein export system ATPase subunit